MLYLPDKRALLGFHKTTKKLLYSCELLTSYGRSRTLRLKNLLIPLEKKDWKREIMAQHAR